MDRRGLDPVAVADLERRLADAATGLSASMAATRRTALRLHWSGPDQQRLVHQVERLRRESDLAAHRLRLTVRILAAHRAEQERVSATVTAPAAPAPAALERARRVQTIEVGVAVPIRVAEVGGEVALEATTRILDDGSVEVDVSIDGELGGGLGLGQHGAATAVGGGQVAATYRFGSRVEADRFVDGLRTELVPRSGLAELAIGLASPAGIVAAGSRATQVVLAQVGAYLGRHSGRHVSTTREIAGGLRIDAGAGTTSGATAAIAGTSVTQRAGGTGTRSVHLAAELEADGAGLDVDGEVRLALREDSDGRRHLVATSDLDVLGSLRPVLAAAGAVELGSPASGTRTDVEMTLELTPATEELVDGLLRRPWSLSDPDRLAEVVEHADVVVQRHELRGSAVGADVDLLRVQGSTVTSRVTATWVKRPHGVLVEVR